MDADALLAATYRGDSRAFESLVRSQGGRLHRLAARVTGDPTLADDVLQETFLRILRVPPAARPSRRAAAWLARVTVRVALNVLESERARRRREERYAAERSRDMKDGSPVEAPLEQDLDGRVAEALASLSPATRAALWLHVVEGEGVRDVAACLDSSRSAVSRRIRAGLESLRARLETGGVVLTGAAALRGALCGAEIPAPESLVERIVDAGSAAMASGVSRPGRDSLDAAIAVPGRTLPSVAGIATAAGITIVLGVLAVLGGRHLLRSEGERIEPAAPVAAATPVAPASADPTPTSEPEVIEAAPASPARRGAVVAGMVRDESGAPVVGADVYIAFPFSPPGDDDLLVSLGSYYRADYFQRSRLLEARTDSEGRYLFEGIRIFGAARLAVFKDGHGDPRTAGSNVLKGVKIEQGVEQAAHDLVLPEGKTLAGRVLARDGSPVADAVISATTAWTPTDHIFWPAGLGPSDAEGRFRLGFPEDAAACHLRVNSARHGQDFFVQVPVSDEEEVELVLNERARLEGTITWAGGSPASGLTVRVNGRLPEPPIPVERMGLRAHVVHDGVVREDGAYAIDGLHPGLHYDILVIDLSPGEAAAIRDPLTPRLRHTFRPEAGEVKTWDHAVERPIAIRGRIRTAVTGAPVPEAQVAVRRDGKRVALTSDWANQEGFFEVRLTTGPGEYRIHAEPPVGFPSTDDAGDLIDERHGQTLNLSWSRDVEVDLTIFEPVILPLRILDAEGEPPKSVHGLLHVTLPGGREFRVESPRSLDETGRTRISLYYPVAEFRYEVAAERGAPIAATSRHAGDPGTVHPEETVVLPRAGEKDG